MKINYNVTEEAFLEFNLFHAKNSKAVKKSMTIQRFLLPVIYLLVAVFLSPILDIPILFLFIPFLLIGVLWGIFYPAYFYYHVKRAAKKMIREGKNEGMFGKQSIIFTEEGVREISPKGETAFSWPGIEKLEEDQTNLYLYNSGMSAFIVPKNSLADVEGIRNYVLSKVGQAAQV